MAVKHVGQAGTALQLLPGYPQRKRVGTQWTLEYRYWCAATSATTLAPAAWAADPAGLGLVCREVTVSPHPAPGMVYMDVTYADPDDVTFPDEQDTVEYESDTEFREVPIEQDPRVDQYEVDAAIAANQRIALLNTVTYTRRELVTASGSAWSETNIVGTVGDIENPTDMTSPTAGKWMHTSRRRRSSGRSKIEVADTWTYDENGWRQFTTTTTTTTTA